MSTIDMIDKYPNTITRVEEVSGGNITIYTSVPWEKEPIIYSDSSGYRTAAADWELGDDYEQVVVSIPSRAYLPEDDFDALWAELYMFIQEFKPWIAWTTDPGKLTLARPVPSREWGVWSKLRIARNAPKTPKRLNLLSQATAIHGEFKLVYIDLDKRDSEHEADVMTVKVRPNPHFPGLTVEESIAAIDGKYKMRASKLFQLIDAYEERTGNTKEAEKFRRHRRWNSRMLTQLLNQPVLFKGDLIICNDEELDADVEVHEENIKTEIGAHYPDVIFVQMFPQTQELDGARTDRQALANFSTSALTPDILKRALVAETDRTIAAFKAGKVPFHIPTDDHDERGALKIGPSLRAMFEKISAWVAIRGHLNDNPYLLSMAAGQVSQMMGDLDNLSEADSKRKYPIPKSVRVSLGNVLDIEWSRGKRVKLKDNTAFIDPKYGLMMNLRTYVKILRWLGGADGDDHVVAIRMIAGFSDEFFDFTAGDVIYFIYRSPIGNSSDGERMASEFWILKAKDQRPKDYNELEVLESRPVCVAELGEIEQTWFGGQKELQDEYTDRQMWADVAAAVDMTGSFGLYCNLLMVMVHHGIAFKPDAPMETYVDEAQQTMSKSGMAHIAATTDGLTQLIVESGVALDPYEAARVGLDEDEDGMPQVDIVPGLFTEMVYFHVDEQLRFLEEARAHILERHTVLKEKHKETKVDWIMKRGAWSVPGVIEMVRRSEQQFTKSNRRNPSTGMDYELVGSYAMRWLQTMINTGFEVNIGGEKQALTEELLAEHIKQAYRWALGDSNVRNERGAPSELIYGTERLLLLGSLLDYTASVLAEEEEI